jgi:hypothetical protein
LIRAGLLGSAFSWTRLDKIDWDVRNFPKRAFAGGAANDDNRVESGRRVAGGVGGSYRTIGA